MAEKHDPTLQPAVRLAIEVHARRDTPDLQLVRELLRARYEVLKETLVGLIPGSAVPGATLHTQGQTWAIHQLLKEIEEGPQELAAFQATQPKSEQE